ncbi:MAG: hypothetical protein ABJA02_01385 [Acidobacteriota bacterium]
MMAATLLGEIAAVYHKHGWMLRRVLVSPKSRESFSISADSVGDAPVLTSDIDALWFSRQPKPGGVPWEIRHLSTEPYSLIFTIDEFDDGFEDSLASGEEQFRSHLAARKEA